MPLNLSKRGTYFVRKDKEDKTGLGPSPRYRVYQWWLNPDTCRLYAKERYHYATREEAEAAVFKLTEQSIESGCLKRLPNGKVIDRWSN